MSDLPLVRTDRVRFAETDAQGIVFYGAFFTWLDEALNAALREAGYDYDRMHADGWTTHVVHTELDYHAPAEYGDVVEQRFAVTDVGESSIHTDYEARNEATGETLASGSTVYAAADVETGESVRVPDDFRAAFGLLDGE
ncbi:acyl-CoA thioesterase [Halospeciosus flavus]|uniref:Acyl-CoA thioesterase n=1 Tax=Halospeciosus flavus TaxID=3032283 RepID=A0ABD5Z097_9EURY|nr:thioesterase family protein [Halospeciosus flavus]